MRFWSALTLVLLLGGCATHKAEYEPNVTFATEKKSVIKGRTTQAEIAEWVGAPHSVTKSSAGNETWTYNKQTYDEAAGGFRGGLFRVGGMAQAAGRTYDLVLSFDKNKVLRDYSVLATH